jgi:hypothetical protein
MAYASWSVVANEQPSASKWNILGTNDSTFNNLLQYGNIRNRQGGTTGAGSWYTTGTSNTDETTTAVFFQAGSIAVNAASVTVTFPTAFAQVPLVLVTTTSAVTANAFSRITAITTTTFAVGQITDAGTAATTESCSWLAIGQ